MFVFKIVHLFTINFVHFIQNAKILQGAITHGDKELLHLFSMNAYPQANHFCTISFLVQFFETIQRHMQFQKL